jgi:hypothetical protein
MDLGMGPHVEFRQVVLRVRFSDGSPMKTVQIRCIGLPVLEGETPWVFGKVVMDSANGSIQFLAPANRTLQLEVKDWYGPGS